MSGYAVAVAVGPQEAEVERLRDLVEAIAAHEPTEPATVVMIDDAPAPRSLETAIAFPPHLTPLPLHHPRHGKVVHYRKGKGICSAILLALQATAQRTDADFVLKLDTDSLVIAPFVARIRGFFRRHPRTGKIGAYTRTPNGDERNFDRNAANVRSLHQPPFHWKQPLASMRIRRDPALQKLREHIGAAVADGYRYGEHCLGGGYALSRPLLEAMDQRGYLDDPSLWLAIDCPEDVMVGLYTKASGFDLANFVADGEVFGVRHKGLAYPPEELLRRGYAVIHAVKNDPTHAEPDIRAFFRARR